MSLLTGGTRGYAIQNVGGPSGDARSRWHRYHTSTTRQRDRQALLHHKLRRKLAIPKGLKKKQYALPKLNKNTGKWAWPKWVNQPEYLAPGQLGPLYLNAPDYQRILRNYVRDNRWLQHIYQGPHNQGILTTRRARAIVPTATYPENYPVYLGESYGANTYGGPQSSSIGSYRI